MSKINTEIRFTGFGGQGIILAGHITGKAASIYANLYSTLTQNYGPESRGGASSAQLIISNTPIFYPNITHPDILVAMSQEGYLKYKDELKSGGIMIIDEDLVKITDSGKDISARGGSASGTGSPAACDCIRKVTKIPSTRLAEQLGKKIVANIVMLGFFAKETNILPKEAMIEAIKTSVPSASIELNMKAFEKGYNY